jgi:hypothetical protein
MAKTIRSHAPEDARNGRDKKRSKGSRAACAWIAVEQRSNRRAVNVALVTHDWNKAMDIGTPVPQAGVYR